MAEVGVRLARTTSLCINLCHSPLTTLSRQTGLVASTACNMEAMDTANDDAMDGNAPPILKMPIEILLRITDRLPTPSLCNMRLTCSALERSLYRSFTDEFFVRKQFMMTEDSLQALIDIAKSRLGQHVRYVYFGLDHFHGDAARPLPDPEKERILRERYGRTVALWSSGAHRVMLTEAFSLLPGLKGVVIRDFNSRRRTRDGHGKEWRSYGSTTLFQETGVNLPQALTRHWGMPQPITPLDQFCSQVFLAIVSALAAAKSTTESIEVMSRQGNYLQDFAFLVPKSSMKDVSQLLGGLRQLHLSLDLSWRETTHWSAQNANQSLTPPAPFLQQFLALMPSLKNLRINEQGANRVAGPALRHLLDSLSTTALPSLEELSLGHFAVELHTLLGLISRFTSLKSLELWKLVMTQDIRDDWESTPKENLWAKLLGNLINIPNLNLTYVKFGILKQQWTEKGNLLESPVSLEFGASRYVQEYTGPDWRHWASGVRGKMSVKWRASFGTGGHGDDDVDDTDSQVGDDNENWYDEGEDDDGDDDYGEGYGTYM